MTGTEGGAAGFAGFPCRTTQPIKTTAKAPSAPKIQCLRRRLAEGTGPAGRQLIPQHAAILIDAAGANVRRPVQPAAKIKAMLASVAPS